MSVQYQGIAGERAARLFLRSKGVYNIQQLDWLIESENPKATGCDYYAIEVKTKEMFKAGYGCKFDGHGLDVSQYERRQRLLENTGIRTFLLVFSLDDDVVYGQWLDILNADKDNYFDTKKGRRVYNIKLFKRLGRTSDWVKRDEIT